MLTIDPDDPLVYALFCLQADFARRLTPTQAGIVYHTMRGVTDCKEQAALLGVAVPTIKNARVELRERLGLGEIVADCLPVIVRRYWAAYRRARSFAYPVVA